MVDVSDDCHVWLSVVVVSGCCQYVSVFNLMIVVAVGRWRWLLVVVVTGGR